MPQAVQWVVLQLADLYDYCVGAQVDAINEKALAQGQQPRFDKVMTDITFRIRNKIKSRAGYVVSATPHSIPPELKWAACYLTLEAMQAGIPGLKLTEDQKNQVQRAVDELELLERGVQRPSFPTDPEPTDVQAFAPAVVVSRSYRTVTRDTMNGI